MDNIIYFLRFFRKKRESAKLKKYAQIIVRQARQKARHFWQSHSIAPLRLI